MKNYKKELEDANKGLKDSISELSKAVTWQTEYIDLQKEEIARQIIRVKYAKKRGVLLFFIGLIGGLLGVYLMSLIF